MELILASQSPRRRALLEMLGLRFTVCAPEIDEHMDPAQPPAGEVARLSREKAQAVAAGPEAVILAADTIVVAGGQVLGKPHDAADAARMLHLLSGREHEVLTGLSVRCGGRIETCVEAAQLRFRPLSEREIAAYLATGEPMDKAGAYGIQGRASIFVEALHGDFYTVMGLPLCRLSQLLRQFGVEILGEG